MASRELLEAAALDPKVHPSDSALLPTPRGFHAQTQNSEVFRDRFRETRLFSSSFILEKAL